MRAKLGDKAAAAVIVDEGDLGRNQRRAAAAARAIIFDELGRGAAVGRRVIRAQRRDHQPVFQEAAARRERARERGPIAGPRRSRGLRGVRSRHGTIMA
jgi:hypothetical protein